MKKSRGKLNKFSLTPYLFISPFYILFLIFGLFPAIFSGILALSKWDGLGAIEFVGLANFERLIHDSNFWISLYNTLIIWFIGTFPMLLMALVLAYVLNLEFIKHKDLWRTLYFIPYVTSVVVITILFGIIFSNFGGLANGILAFFGLEPVRWLDSPFWVRAIIASINIWQYTGYNMIIYLTGLSKIPNELYEAARMDGANNTQIFWNVTIPQLRPIIVFTVLMSTIGGLQIFTEAQVLVPAGATPEGGSMTVSYYLYNVAFTQSQFGYGSAIAWSLVIVIVLFSILNTYLTSKE